ncbi:MULTISPECIES: NAD(P)/FAD-dependent oxidoreductase [Sinorhizobium]|uniref:Oxidoreductase n=2 Tax=Sinorhizobium TaxID=28105 RepID=A0A2S3YTI8_9HYPH|nr:MULTISPECIES: FAD-binding oxidoreductase [Sinorhizobium]AUX80543.1 FAD dependent oxidoreductase protein [Sinorhizobium fredii]PDT37552.1 FAD-dependent oxidoreductase [Sinorhizobium sp. FG01]POH34966.1 oxidoreductase [Sinorhizobium americanum]
MSYPDTYYRKTMADTKVRPVLSEAVECDTVIIGGGLAGLTTALQLALAGQSVIVLEAECIGFGASGRNGGFVSPGFATGSAEIARRVGAEAARQLHHLSIEGVDFVRETIEQLKIDGARPQPGLVSVLRYDDGMSLKAHADEMKRAYGYALDYLDTDQVRSVLKSKRYFHGLRDGRAFHMHPLNYLRGIADEVERLGGRIYERSAAIATALGAAEKTVQTIRGKVKARQVVFTTGGYSGRLHGPLKRAFLPIATYVMLSEEAPELIRTAIATDDAVGDNRRAGDYYRLVDGGKRLLWGGRITTRAASPAALARELRCEMVGTYPQLKELKTELAWSGLMSYARHLMPQIGEMQPGVWHCTAFGGHGLNTTAIGGKLVAEAILGQSDRYKLFKSFGLVWAGGYAGLAVAQLTYWKLQAQDWWRERAA